MWAVLAWLQILAVKTQRAGKLVTVEDVAKAHWAEYGRNYYARYDYEGVDKARAEAMMTEMSSKSGTLVGQTFGGMVMKTNDMFEYTDPVDGSISRNQGYPLHLRRQLAHHLQTLWHRSRRELRFGCILRSTCRPRVNFVSRDVQAWTHRHERSWRSVRADSDVMWTHLGVVSFDTSQSENVVLCVVLTSFQFSCFGSVRPMRAHVTHKVPWTCMHLMSSDHSPRYLGSAAGELQETVLFLDNFVHTEQNAMHSTPKVTNRCEPRENQRETHTHEVIVFMFQSWVEVVGLNWSCSEASFDPGRTDLIGGAGSSP